MALSDCRPGVDRMGRELVHHGTTLFPIACYEDDLKNYSVPWHWHDEFEAILPRKGKLEVRVENDRIEIGPGQGIFINSGVLHAAEKEPGTEGEFRSLVFHARLVGGSVDSVFWQELIRPVAGNSALRYLHLEDSAKRQGEIIAWLNRAWETVAQEREDYENETRYELTKAFGLLRNCVPSAVRKFSAQERIAGERMKHMLQYIEEHYTEELTVSMIADSVSVSESACQRCFRQMTGTTPIRYVRQFRIQKAQELLLDTEMHSNEVGSECGFSDFSYFTKSFREQTGYTPAEYRKAFRP